MRIGVPKEIKTDEYRVGMVPAGVKRLSREGHSVRIQSGAGLGTGVTDEEYRQAGATVAEAAKEVFSESELIVKVKEPQESEWSLLSAGQTVFTYFHFASSRTLLDAMRDRRITAVAYETVRTHDGLLPLLTPMSEVAGRLAVQEGAECLEEPHRGRGILLGGVPGVEPATVVVIGAGIVGANAARIAAGMGANVYLLDISVERLRALEATLPANVHTVFCDEYVIRDVLPRADLVIGAVLVPGAAAPKVIRRDMIAAMKKGSVIVDVSVDHGGCCETTRPTTHSNPTYLVDGVVHYCVTNMPGAVPRTSSYALSNATIPYVRAIAAEGIAGASRRLPELRCGINTVNGRLTCPAVADTFSLPCHDPLQLLEPG